jgi:hypothetical protein
MTASFFQSAFYCIGCMLFCYVAWMYTKILSSLHAETSVLKAPMAFSLDEEDFNCLVRGGVLNVFYTRHNRGQVVKVILKDIGFHRMEKCLEDAISKTGTYSSKQDHNKLVD